MAIVEIPLNKYGLVGEQDPSRLRTGHLDLAWNVDYASNGRALQKDGGTLKANTESLTATILTGTEYWATPTTQRRVLWVENVPGAVALVYKINPATPNTATVLVTGLGTGLRRGQFVAGGAEKAGRDAKLFFFNGFNPIQVLAADGATMANIANGAAEWTGNNQPSFGFLFRSHLLAGGAANDSNRIYGSELEDHEKFNSATGFSMLVYPGTGTKLVAGLSSLGRGFLFKSPRGIFAIDDSASSTTGWFTTLVSASIGVPDTPHAAVGIGEGGVAFLTHTGDVMLMQESDGSLTGVTFTNLTKTLNLTGFINTTFDLSFLKYSQMFWYEHKKQLHVTYSTGAFQGYRLILDFNYETVRVSAVDKDWNQSIWGETDSTNIVRPLIGDGIGFVHRLDQDTKTANGTPYSLLLSTKKQDFSDVDPQFAVKKLFYRLHLEYLTPRDPTPGATITAKVFIDERPRGTVTFLLEEDGITLSGDDELVFRLSHDIGGEGYYFRVRIEEPEPLSAQDPKLGRLWVEFQPTAMNR